MKTNLDLKYELEGVFGVTMQQCDWCTDCWAYYFEDPSVHVLIFDGTFRVSFGGFLVTYDIKEVLEVFKRISDNPTDFVPVF